ncbi:hypothetical protein [Acidocella sp.]|uniref:hypothetical protein n=1 Tax=Acidocella sp. TaxID=50710 RepID=UPI00261AF5B8|nr:hypothetical protein [Acidocella sp.]
MRDQPQANLRGLKVLVGGMGVLIVLGTAVVVGTVIHRIYARKPAASMVVAPMVPGASAATAVGALAPGEHIAGIAGAGSDVAVWVNGPGGDRLLLVDPASGQVSVALSTTR